MATKLMLIIRIPEHFHAEDELENLLQDDGMLDDLLIAIDRAVSDWVSKAVEGIAWGDVELEINRIAYTIAVKPPGR